MQIKIVCWFLLGKGGDKVLGNGVIFGVQAPNKYSKTEALNIIGQRSNLCQRHIPRKSFNSKTN